jgi:hypothetical protein
MNRENHRATTAFPRDCRVGRSQYCETTMRPPLKVDLFSTKISPCFHRRVLRGDALPVSIRHLDPRVGPTIMRINRLARRVGALTYERAGRYGSVAIYRYLHVLILDTGPFCRFRLGQRLAFVRDVPVTIRTHELVGPTRNLIRR